MERKGPSPTITNFLNLTMNTTSDINVKYESVARKTTVMVVKDIRKFKGRKILLRCITGHYSNLEKMNVCGRNSPDIPQADDDEVIFDECDFLYKEIMRLLKIIIEEYGNNKAQAGWDPLGGFAVAESISKIGDVAAHLNTSLNGNVERISHITNDFKNVIMSTLSGITPDVNTLAQAAERVSNHGLDLNIGIQKLLSEFTDPTTVMFVGCIMYLVLEVCERKYELRDLFMIKVLLGAYMVFIVGKPMLHLVSSWFNPVTSAAQSDWSDWLQVGVQGVMFVMCGSTLDMSNIVVSLRQTLSVASDCLKLQELFNTITEWLKKALTMVCEGFGLELWDWLLPQDLRLKKMMKSVNDLMIQYGQDPMGVSIAFAEDVTRLTMEVNSYMSSLPINSKNQPVIMAVKNLQDKMQILHRNVSDAGMSLGERSDPALLVIAGPPEVGKTYFSEFIAQSLIIEGAETVAELAELQRSWKSQIYTWPIDNKHHDQYNGAKITVYPDLFSQTDAEGQPSEATALIYLVGGQPVQLPAAEITKKQKLYFVSEVIMACTNVTFIHPKMFKSLRNDDAVRRRLDAFGWYMYVNPQYIQRNADGSVVTDATTNRIRGYEMDHEMYGRLDVTKIPRTALGEIPDDIWSFRRLNFTKGEFSDNKIYTLRNFLRVTKQYVANVKERGDIKRSNVKARTDVLVASRMAELDGLAQEGAIEFEEVEEREVRPFVDRSLPIYVEREMNIDRQLRKDRIDVIRHYQLEEQLREMLEESNNNDGYDTADDNVAQMDNGSRYRFTPLDSREIGDHIDMNDLENTVGAFHGAKMLREAQSLRDVRWYQRIRFYPEFNVQHWTRMREIIADAERMVDFSTVPDFRGLALMAATRNGEYSPRRGVVMSMLQHAVRAMDDDRILKDIVKYIRVDHILELTSMASGDAVAYYRACCINTTYKDPFVASCVTMYDALCSTYETITTFVNNIKEKVVNLSIIRRVSDWFFSDRIQGFIMEFLEGFALGTMLTLPILFMQYYLTTSMERAVTKRRYQDALERHKLKTVSQGSWTAKKAVSETIDKYMNNFCGLYVIIHMGDKVATRHPCNVIFLGGRTAIMVDHTRQALIKMQEEVNKHKGHYIELRLVPFKSTSCDKSTESCLYQDVIIETSDDLMMYDLTVITFPNCDNRNHIYHMIPSIECINHIIEMKNLEGVFIERTTDEDLSFRGPEKRRDVFFNFKTSFGGYNPTVTVYGEHHVLDPYEYQSISMKGVEELFVTRPGYCTSPGFLIDERKNFCVNKGWKQAQCPWLLYAHTSIQGSVPNGAPMYREMFNTWISRLESVKQRPMQEVIQENIEIYDQVLKEELDLGEGDQSNSFELLSTVSMVDDRHQSVLSMEHKFFVPQKSDIKRSKLYGVEERTRYPSRMGTVRLKNGDIVDTMKKARVNYGRNSVLLNAGIVRDVIHQAMSRIVTDSGPIVKTEVLTLDQALYGDNAYKLNSVNWNSSAGFYFRLIKDKYGKTWKSKRWMVDDETRLVPEMERAIIRLHDHFDAKVRAGERIYGINIDNIKDELLKKEKVMNADSRLFCTNDFIVLLLCKRYMGAFAGWIYENRINNHIAIGVNPYSDEWTAIATSLVNNSPDIIFADHSKFDKDQLRLFMESVVVLMDMFYQDKGSENSRARQTLFLDIVNSVHVVMYEGKLHFYMWSQGNTSGNFLTAILNSCVNFSYLYMCAIFAWLENKGVDPLLLTSLPPNPADDALKAIILGDDIAVSVNSKLMPGFNFNTFTAMGEYYLGITITDELKTGGIIPDFRKITEGSFLGCMFVENYVCGKLEFLARLRYYSCVENVQWIKGISDPEIEVAKIEDSFLKLSHHPIEVYEAFVRKVAPLCKEAYGVYPKYTDYHVARRHLKSFSEYRYSFYDFICGDYEGGDIGLIIRRYQDTCEETRCKSGYEDEGSCDSSDFNVKLTDHKTTLGGEPSSIGSGAILRA